MTGSQAIGIRGVLVGAAVLALAASARADGDKLRIQGSVASTVTRLSTTAAVDYQLVIQSMVDEPVSFTVDVGSFVDSKGRSFDASAQLAGAVQRTATIAPLGTVPLSIAGSLPDEAEYISEITLSYPGTRQLARLVVVRTVGPAAVNILTLEAVRAEASTFRSSNAALELVLEETAGRATTVGTVELTSFTLKAGGSRQQAHASLTIGPGPFRDPKDLQGRRVVLGNHQTVRVPIVLGDLAGAGEYSGTIRFSSTGQKPVDQSFTLTLRESRWTAVVFLLIGSLLSIAWQLVMTRSRPRLLRKRRLELLARQIEQRSSEPSLDVTERSLLWAIDQSVAAQLDAIHWKAADKQTEASRQDEAIKLLEQRYDLVGLWVQLYRELRSIEPPDARAQMLAELDQARVDVISGTAAVLSRMDVELQKLRKTAQEAVKAALTSRIAMIRSALAAIPMGPAGVTDQAEVQVIKLLEEADDKLKRSDLAEATHSYQEARKRWLPLSLAAFDALLAEEPPPGLDATTWKTLLDAVKPDLAAARAAVGEDPDTAIVHYRRAQVGYLVTAAEGLRRAIDKALGKLDTSSGDSKAGERRAALAAARSDASNARAAAYRSRIDEASAALESAQIAYQGVRRKTLGADKSTPPDASLVAIPEAVAEARSSERPLASFRPVSGRWISLLDCAALGSAIIAATVLGFTLLWEASLTWGGGRDYVAAVLWGLGLHGAAFSGTAAAFDKLAGRRKETAS